MASKKAARKSKPGAKKAAAERKLTDKQAAFVDAYLARWNATQAAIEAKYSKKTAYAQGSRLLRNVEVRAAIDARLADMGMGANEVLARLSEHASASMDDFIDAADGKPAALNLAKAARRGKMHLVKKFKVGVEGVSIELHDPQAALVHLGRYHRLFTDRVQVRTWRDGVVDLLRAGQVKPADVVSELGDDLAAELLALAGIEVTVNVDAEPAAGA